LAKRENKVEATKKKPISIQTGEKSHLPVLKKAQTTAAKPAKI